MVHTLSIVVSSSILIAAFSLYVVHWFRRSLWQTRSATSGAPGIEGGETAGFDRVQRLFHWSVTIATVVLAVSGLILYYPAYVAPFLNSVGVPVHSYFVGWVDIHVIGAVILLGLIVAHVAWDSFKLRTTKLMVPNREDAREAMVRAWRFVWGGSPTPRSSKYDVFMKSYHALLIVCSLGLGVTGLVQYVWAPWWKFPEILHLQIEPWWKPTILHDLFGFILIGLVVGHTYFTLLMVNRPLLKAMVTGVIARDEAMPTLPGGPANGIPEEAMSSPIVGLASPGPNANGVSLPSRGRGGTEGFGLAEEGQTE